MKEFQSWITFASDDTEAIKALVLSRSLRRVITRRFLTIFVAQEVSEEICEILEEGFDRCVRITNSFQSLRYPGLRFGTVAKVHSWKLKLEKIVFLDPNCLVLRNSDELFRQDGMISYKDVSDPNGNGINDLASVFLGSPSPSKFKKLYNVATKQNSHFETAEGKYLEKICDLKADPWLQQKYDVSVNFRKMDFASFTPEANIVNFVGHPVDFLMDMGNDHKMLEEMCLEGTLERGLYDTCLDLIPAQELAWLKGKFASPMRGKIEELLQNPPLALDTLDELKHSIAIVGMGMRLPQANTLDEFWDLLVNGKDGITPVPETRWSPSHCFGRTESSKYTRAGFLKCPVDEIDGKFFGMSPHELTYMDPQQRLTLQILWEALEHSGINPTSLKNTNTAVFGGWWRHDYKEMLQESGLVESDFFRTYMGNSLGTLTGRVSHFLDLTGPSISTESGCSTSIVAVDQACKTLLSEDCDLGLAFGVNLLLHPFSDQILNSVIAPDGHCKTFDAKADGFGRAEGCVALVLKRFPDAVRDGDRIHAVIRGSAVVQEGPSRSMGTPTKGCEALAMTLALEDAGIHPSQVSFVETHGTGTPVGDPLEVAAVAEAYSLGRESPLYIGSVKTNIGHTESCSGISGMIKTVLSLQNETIPPHCNFQELNPDIKLEAIPALIPLEPVEWKRMEGDKPRIAGVSSFGITGTDAHVIIQETPTDIKLLPYLLQSPDNTKQLQGQDSKINVMRLSAKSPEYLDDLLQKMKEFLRTSEESFEDICYTANVGRGDFACRSILVGNKASMIEQIQKKSVLIKQLPSGAGEGPKICFLFTGQGSQHPQMAKDLYDSNPIFQMHFDTCSKSLEEQYGISIKEAMWGSQKDGLSRSIYSQTSIFCVEYALYKLWGSWGIKPDCVLGHSLGEFCAAVAAGILKVEDALKLVAERSKLIDSLEEGGMIALKKSQREVEALIKDAFRGEEEGWLDYAALNSPEQTVLAGTVQNVSKFAEYCQANDVKTHMLQSTHAFHSRMMDPILKKYREVAEQITYNNSNENIKFISGMDGVQLPPQSVDSSYWVRHTKEPVRFISASTTVLEGGVTQFLEVGPQPVLSALVLYNADSIQSLTEGVSVYPSIRRNEEELNTIYTSLGRLYCSGFPVNWRNFHELSCTKKKITIPYYPFQNKSYWVDVSGDRHRAIHPLVGSQHGNPSSIKLFQNNLDLSNARFLRDHVIGNTIICPGAGYLEMCLVAGHASIQCLENDYTHPVAPISLEEFQIEAPLAFNDGEKTHMQIIVSTEDSGETRMTIYSKLILDKETHKWIRHASALFSPFAVTFEEDEFIKTDTLEEVNKRCTNPRKTDKRQNYDRFTKLGLKFGPTFQTLETAWEGDGEVIFKVNITESSESYICHPILIDAMFQAIMVAINCEGDILSVPISVSQFICYGRISSDSAHCYIHGKRKKDGEYMAVLYDSDGQKLAVMVGATYLETNTATILAGIEAQRTSLPNMYEEVWREQLGTWDRRIEKFPDFNLLFSQEYKDSFKDYCYIDGLPTEHYSKKIQLCMNYVLKSFLDLGWKPKVGETFWLQDFMSGLKIPAEFKGYVRQQLMTFVKEGLLSVEEVLGRENTMFKVLLLPPPTTELSSSIAKSYKELVEFHEGETMFLSNVGKNLADILTKKISGLSILFPEDAEKGSAESFYREGELGKSNLSLGTVIFQNVFDDLVAAKRDKDVIRILELGAGTGSMSKHALDIIQQNPSAVEYTYTDLSPAFWIWGEKIFGGSKVKTIYKTLNIEHDPSAQGFVPHSYDIIFASYVIHATKDIRISMKHVKNLLRPKGLIMLNELTDPHFAVNMTFGVLEGFWRFQDYELRPFNCEIRKEQWEVLLKEGGFERVNCFPSYFDHSAVIWAQGSDSTEFMDLTEPQNRKGWLVFTREGDPLGDSVCDKLEEMGRDVRRVYPGSNYRSLEGKTFTIRTDEGSDMKQIFEEIRPHLKKNFEGILFLWGVQDGDKEDFQSSCHPFLSLCQILASMDNIKVVVATKGVISLGDHVMPLPTAGMMWGMLKTLQNENHNVDCKCVDLDPTANDDCSVQDLISELLVEDSEISIAYRNRRRNVCRFISYKVPKSSLSFPKSERFKLALPASNAIRDLRFTVAKPPASLNPSDVEIRVKAYALNFRDLLVVLKPDSQFETWSTLGIDFAGDITAVGSDVKKYKVGDGVFGFVLNFTSDALPSHLISHVDLLLPIPEDMTYCDASTLPCVAATAYMGLVSLAKVQAGETVLIHTGSGGVGLCAIQIAQMNKCRIIATAGSNKKRAYLRNLGIEHVFNSRNTSYEADIKRVLGGNKVDVVLNSLTGVGFKEASLSVLKEGGRFIEMSKLNTWTHAEVKALRADVHYEIIVIVGNESQVANYLPTIHEFMKVNKLRPIPYTRFDAGDIREALVYMQKAKHIGKIVCVMPDANASRASLEAKTPFFNDRSTYLITGGLGGIGLEICKWMTSSGAKYIVLAGRSPPSVKAQEEIKLVNLTGAVVSTVQCDVGDYSQCKNVLDFIASSEELPPLRGIMHAAGVLSDASFENQTWEKYLETLNPKVVGGWNLHKLTKDLALEHFVMFSSGVASFGAMGQSNHAAANFYLDSLAHYRNSLGLAATTVNWGQWGQVGVAAYKDVIGLRPMTPLQCVSALESLLKVQKSQTCVLEANFSVLRKAFMSKKYLEELKEGLSEKIQGVQVSSEEFWKEYDSKEDSEGRIEIVSRFLRVVVRHILKLDDAEVIDDNAQLQDMGMDSLMMIEMKNVLQSVVGNRAKITVNSVKDCRTIAQLALRVVELVSGVEAQALPTREEFVALIREDGQLPPSILPRESQPACKPSEISTVLITGVSGNLGPYILREVSRLPQITKIYCLMRPTTKTSLKQRLLKLLNEKEMAKDIRMDIVECIGGNIIQDKLGLDSSLYGKLAEEVQAVLHMGVKSVWQDIYRRDRYSDQDIRTVNVFGTTNVIEFACASRIKHFYYSSSTLTASTLEGPEGEERLMEEWPELEAFDTLPNDAYAVSKFICELRLSQAVERGVPVKVFRFPLIGGDSVTGGNINPYNSQVLLRMMSYLYMGVMPAYKVPIMLIPVDLCAELSVQIFFRDGAPFEVYNVSNPYLNDEQEFEDVAEELGYKIEVVEIDEYLDRLEQTEDNEVMVFMKNGAENSEFRDRILEDVPTPALLWMSGRKDVFVSRKLATYLPNYPGCMETSMTILRRDMIQCKKMGAFAKLGIK